MPKVNPKRVPLNKADLDKFYRKLEEAKKEALREAWTDIMLALGDIEGFDAFRMERIWNRACSYADDHKKGRSTLEEDERILREEYGAVLIL